MSNEEDEQSTEESEQSVAMSADSGESSSVESETGEQSDNPQGEETDQSAAQPSEITADESQQSEDAGPPTGDTSQQASPLDEATRNRLELDLQSEDVIPATLKNGDCSSWESDPRSFAKRIADNYLSTEFDHMPGVVGPAGMSCWASQPNKNVSDFCYLHYSDGWNVVVSLSNIPDYVKVRAIEPERKPVCTYSYDCTDAGTLTFTRRGCSP
ncbi:MAG TPA: hypothetical protein VFQ78_12665 [Candidatus Udaeobacter sp.]|nr:hypothetical protein [Candidatus Udaeobacter sp.]